MSRRPSQEAVSLLATTFVLLGGLATITFILLTAVDNPLPWILATIAGTGSMAVLFWLLRDRQDRPQMGWWVRLFRSKTERHSTWHVRRRSPPPAPAQPLAPPTVEQVRDAATHGSTWVPRRDKQP